MGRKQEEDDNPNNMSSAAVMIQEDRKISWRSKKKGSLCIYLTKPEMRRRKEEETPKRKVQGHTESGKILIKQLRKKEPKDKR
jgi:hypothetical protein